MSNANNLKQSVSDEEILARINTDFDAANEYFTNEMQDKLEKWEQLANGGADYYEKHFPQVPGQYVSRDIANTVEFILPDLLKLFNSAKEPLTVRGRTLEDVPKADVMQALCNWQLNSENNHFINNYVWFKDALYYGFAVLKARWDRKYTTKEFEAVLDKSRYQELLQTSDIKVISVKPFGAIDPLTGESFVKVKYELEIMESNKPVFENLRAAEFRFDPDAKTIKDAAFVIHLREVTADYLKRQEQLGVYSNIDKAISTYKTQDSYGNNDVQNEYSEKSYNKGARKKFQIREYYGKIDINDDGLLEDLIVTTCGSTILSVQENTFGRYPFFILSGILEPHQLFGRSISELVEQLQNLKTILIRELINNTIQNNDRRVFVNSDALVDSNALATGAKYVATSGDPRGVIYYEPFEPLSPTNMELIRFADKEKEMNSGISEIKQGVTPRSSNSATEASLLYEAANARVQLIARVFAETGIKDLYEWLVDANQKFITQPQVIRLTNKFLEVDPSSLQNASFDLEISSGISTGAAEQRMAGLQTLFANATATLLPLGLTDKSRIRNIYEKITEELGFKNVDDFIFSKQELETIEIQSAAQNAPANTQAELLNQQI